MSRGTPPLYVDVDEDRFADAFDLWDDTLEVEGFGEHLQRQNEVYISAVPGRHPVPSKLTILKIFLRVERSNSSVKDYGEERERNALDVDRVQCRAEYERGVHRSREAFCLPSRRSFVGSPASISGVARGGVH